MNNLPSLPQFVAVMAVAAIVMLAGGKLLGWWVDRPLPYPDPASLGERCVCRERTRRAGVFGWSAPPLIIAAFVVAAFTPAAWLGLGVFVVAVVLLFWSMRLERQVKLAHEGGRCCCPDGRWHGRLTRWGSI